MPQQLHVPTSQCCSNGDSSTRDSATDGRTSQPSPREVCGGVGSRRRGVDGCVSDGADDGASGDDGWEQLACRVLVEDRTVDGVCVEVGTFASNACNPNKSKSKSVKKPHSANYWVKCLLMCKRGTESVWTEISSIFSQVQTTSHPVQARNAAFRVNTTPQSQKQSCLSRIFTTCTLHVKQV